MKGLALSVSPSVGKILAMVIALGYVGVAVADSGPTLDILKLVVVLLFPLALIWFPEALGSATGYVGRGATINTETPPILVSIFGWFFLVGLPALIWLLERR